MLTYLIDDDVISLYLTEHVLQLENFATEVRSFMAAPEALAFLLPRLATELPQVIFLDLNMPVMNGWEFLAAYQQLPPVHPRPLIVLLSSSDHDLAQARAEHLPVDAFLPKPLTREKVQKLLEEYF